LEEERDLKLTDIITQLQALSRGVLARKYLPEISSILSNNSSFFSKEL
jgi:hypothetical protein